MSVRIDASGDYLRRTANLPPLTTWTMAAWVYYVATRSAWAYVMGMEDATSSSTEWKLLGFTDGNAFHVSWAGSSTANFAANPATSAWHFMALVANGTAVTGYHWTETGTLQTTTASSGNAGWTPVAVWFGNDSFDEWANVRIAAPKIWDAVLTQAELEQEMRVLRPQRFADLNVWSPAFPGASERLLDYSGNGRNFTAGGTLTDEDPPPVSWGAGGWTAPFAEAVVADTLMAQAAI